MRLHLLGLAHTVSNDRWTHCAFSGKIIRLPAMMVPLGYEVVHYGVEGADTAATEHVTLMSQEEQAHLRGHPVDPASFVGNDSNVDSPLWREFNRRLRRELRRRVVPEDLVLLPFGHAHQDALAGLNLPCVESGIGYSILYDGARFKVFESYAWMHWHQGRANRQGGDYEWVVPNYFDVDAWDFQPEPDRNTVVYFGRICETKGLNVVREIAARRPDLRFVLCGQGDPTPWVGGNVEYLPPIAGRERSALLGNARAVLMPSRYTEPFGGVAVEAALCGTPALASDFGAFAETIENGRTGFRCHTLGDWLAALELAPTLDRRYIRDRAAFLYGYGRVGRMYDRVFRQIADLEDGGWYSLRTAFALPPRIEHVAPACADHDVRGVPLLDGGRLGGADHAMNAPGGGLQCAGAHDAVYDAGRGAADEDVGVPGGRDVDAPGDGAAAGGIVGNRGRDVRTVDGLERVAA